jgi:hypothetical protein
MKKIIPRAIAIAVICLLPAILGHLLRETSGVATSQEQAAAMQTGRFLDNLDLIASR